MIIEITTGQVSWLIGVVFLVISSIIYAAIKRVNVALCDEDKILLVCLVIAGLVFIFLGVNHDFKIIEVKVI